MCAWADAYGRSGSVISATISVERYKRIGVEIYNHGDVTKAIFDGLYAQKEAIEAELGTPLEWQRLEGKKATRIALFKSNEDPSDPSGWPRQHDWMFTQMTNFKRVFAPRLKAMQFAISESVNIADGQIESEQA